MNHTPDQLLDVVSDIEAELARVHRVAEDVTEVVDAIGLHSDVAPWLNESIALKLHNYYTGCERIFQTVATELNGGLPSGAEWHIRLLDRMSQQRERRIAVVSITTAQLLQPYLSFRHVVRNIYGFELDPNRLLDLARRLPATHAAVYADVRQFMSWLRGLAEGVG